MFPIIDINIPAHSKKVLNDLEKAEEALRKGILAESENIGMLFTDRITEYPPETDGNQPPPPYYSRGVGYIRKGGAISPVSEQFGDNVVYRTVSTTKEVILRITLRPSYSKWLVGSNGQQAWFHRRNGWKTIRTVLRGLNIDADETTNATVPATSNMRKVVQNVTIQLKQYS